MSIRLAFRTVALLAAFSLAGCGLFDWEEREPWRAQAEAACFARGEVKLSTLIQPVSAVEGSGICGLDRPLKVTALADGTVRIGSRSVIVSCPMTSALERWVAGVVMPAAYSRYGMPVAEIRSMGTYNCRSRNNVPGARLSEHAFANAFDVGGFVLADGRLVTVRKGWRGGEADRAFLREVTAGACGPFTTVLGPGSDGMHEDHLHLDLARHDAAGTRRYCKPKLNVPAPSWPPTYQVGPDVEAPIASLPPGETAWPRVLPQTLSAAEASDAGMLPPAPMPSAPLAGPAPMPPASVAGAPVPPASVPGAQAPVACPPGYVCQPIGNAPPPPVLPGWNVGPQPVRGLSAQGYMPFDEGAAPLDE